MKFSEWIKRDGFWECLVKLTDTSDPIVRLRTVLNGEGKWEPVIRQYEMPGGWIAGGEPVTDLTAAHYAVKALFLGLLGFPVTVKVKMCENEDKPDLEFDQTLVKIEYDVQPPSNLLLRYKGIDIFWCYRDEHHGEVQEWSDSYVGVGDSMKDRDDDDAFDIDNLDEVPDDEMEKYVKLFPDVEGEYDQHQVLYKRRLAYAIDQGDITEDGYQMEDED